MVGGNVLHHSLFFFTADNGRKWSGILYFHDRHFLSWYLFRPILSFVEHAIFNTKPIGRLFFVFTHPVRIANINKIPTNFKSLQSSNDWWPRNSKMKKVIFIRQTYLPYTAYPTKYTSNLCLVVCYCGQAVVDLTHTCHCYLTTALIARFTGPAWGHLGTTGPRWAPCWPHEPCYLGAPMRQRWWIW